MRWRSPHPSSFLGLHPLWGCRHVTAQSGAFNWLCCCLHICALVLEVLAVSGAPCWLKRAHSHPSVCNGAKTQKMNTHPDRWSVPALQEVSQELEMICRLWTCKHSLRMTSDRVVRVKSYQEKCWVFSVVRFLLNVCVCVCLCYAVVSWKASRPLCLHGAPA